MTTPDNLHPCPQCDHGIATVCDGCKLDLEFCLCDEPLPRDVQCWRCDGTGWIEDPAG